MLQSEVRKVESGQEGRLVCWRRLAGPLSERRGG